AAHALMAQRESIITDFGAAGRPMADSLNARVVRLASDVDRALTGVNAQRSPIEGWSGLPTADVQRALGYRIADARTALADLDRLVTTDIPAAYRRVAKKAWAQPVAAVPVPVVR
ncbi:MAG: hypothetical protein ACRENQ_11475, partial [Gemmatimonadaceae bacterium]